MNKNELEGFTKQAVKSIKIESGLSSFRKVLTKVTVEAALNAELDEHLGFFRHEPSHKDNYRNEYSSTTMLRKVVKSI